MKALHISLLFLLILPACIPKKHVKKVTVTRGCILHASKEKTAPITIWIHGTRFIRRPFFYQCFNGIPSLRGAAELDPESCMYDVIHTLNASAPALFPLETCYAFGWSGKLSSRVRQEAARHLYTELQRIVSEYKAQFNCHPKIRILSHSHGGTVALNLAYVERKPTDIPLEIDELVLLACPVQKATKKCIENPIFKHTCALYSGLDMVQVLAPQLTYSSHVTKKGNIRSKFHWPPFSKRTFEKHPKLAQAKIKINGRALFHTEFTSNHFISILPHILHVLNSSHKHTEYDTQLLCVYMRDGEEKEKAAELLN